MKRLSHMLGVTLLEIMLVLAIAAMVIVMSIRYYTSATISQQANSIRSQVQAIAAAMDNLSVGAGTYSGVTTSMLTNAMGGIQNMKTPWNTTITMTSPSATNYVVTIPGTTTTLCAAVMAQLKTNPRFSTAACSASALTYTYDSTK